MIEIKKIDKEPYTFFYKKYEAAITKNQKNIEAISISSFDLNKKEVDSRFVNLKYINNEDWIFFTNYQSKKASQFKDFKQISALIYWDSIDTQVRIKANIKKLDSISSDEHFIGRSAEKNALAISSEQSKKIDSYEDVVNNYKFILKSKNINLNKRPNYWGGFLFNPYYFEFWQGHENRLNKRNVFEKTKNGWKHYMLQP